MARFNWETFLKRHSIQYVTSGPNASRGHVNVKCPFCGASDPTEHMGISVKGLGWSCWRNSAHRGRSPVRLIMQLIRCTEDEARKIAGVEEKLTPDDNDLGALLGRLQPQAASPIKKLELDRELRSMANGSMIAGPFFDYIEDRGYRPEQVDWMVQHYDLHYARSGPFAWRVIFPIRDAKRNLITWVGRGITEDADPRYKALKRALANGIIKDQLLDLPNLHRAPNRKVLVICEGPFDATRITVNGHQLGVWATCLFGLSIQPAQIELLHQLAPLYERTYLMIDPDADIQRLRLLQALGALKTRVATIPKGVKDPGALTSGQAFQVAFDLATMEEV